MVRNRIFPAISTHIAERAAYRRSPDAPLAARGMLFDPLSTLRWGKIRALRAAITAGSYDLDTRLDDLLDNPPAELANLAWS